LTSIADTERGLDTAEAAQCRSAAARGFFVHSRLRRDPRRALLHVPVTPVVRNGARPALRPPPEVGYFKTGLAPARNSAAPAPAPNEEDR
jgi:hypothetical protein